MRGKAILLLFPFLKVVHDAHGAVELDVHRPDIGRLAVEAVGVKLTAEVHGEAEIVAEIVFENDAETKCRQDVEGVRARQVFVRVVVGTLRIVFRIGKMVRNGTAETDIHLRVVGRIVFAQRMPVDDVIHEKLRAAERIGMNAIGVRRQQRGAGCIRQRCADFVRIGEIVPDNRLVIKGIAFRFQRASILGRQHGNARLKVDEPAFPVLRRSNDGLGRQFQQPQQQKRQRKEVFSHKLKFFLVKIRLRQRACMANPPWMNLLNRFITLQK